MKCDAEKDEINFRLVEYFSVLINQIISYNHLKRSQSYRENFLNFHLALVADRRNIKLQYQSIRDKFNFFIQPQTITDDLKFYQVKDEGIEWIEIWHLLFIFNVYFDYLKTTKDDIDDIYIKQMHDILEKCYDALLKINEKEEYNHYSDWVFEEWKELLHTVRNLIDTPLYNENIQSRWNDFWRKNKGLCTKVAEAVGYISYFEIYEDDISIKYKLIPEKVWEDLKKIVKSGKELESLQRFENFLYELQDINEDFTKISLIVDCISKIKIPDVLNSIHVRWVGLSSGELGLLKSFANLYSAKINLQGKTFPGVATTNYVLLFDEIDLGLHPEWQRKWISRALPIIEKIFHDKHLQVIITTHSPIFLSDIYKENILFLTRDNNEETNDRLFEKTFGQNIYTLFKDSFFLQDVMGEYAYNTIKDTIEYLSFKVNSNSSYSREENLYNYSDEIINEKIAKKVIDSVGEPIIANQLKELFYRAFPNKNDESIEIRNRIAQLQKKLEQLEGERSQ
ncbi:AAA family ATPase [Streptococcus mitis]|uniref:AAA family ATPase n=2 Tax=Streptococcus mitis TaxID=28037 RepID=A0A7X1V4B3_STRMT|nr:AAA family ATPase [Streptococcus mitis]